MGYLTSVDRFRTVCAWNANIGDNFLDNLGHDRAGDARGQEEPGRPGAAISADGGFAQH